MASQQTFVMVKPDGVRRRLVGEIIRRIEVKGYDIRELRLMTVDESLAKKHYAEHVDKPFFDELVSFVTSGPSVAMVVEGALLHHRNRTQDREGGVGRGTGS